MRLVQIFARNLKAVRRKKRMTHAQLASAAKLSTSYLSMLEHATRTPALETIDALARGLGVSPLALIDPETAPRSERHARAAPRRSVA